MPLSHTDRPVIVTCGDPNGVGLDISIAAHKTLHDSIPFVLIADPNHIDERGYDVPITVIEELDAYDPQDRSLSVLRHAFSATPNLNGIQYENAADTIAVIERGVDTVQKGHASALVTNPIHKYVLQKGAKFAHPGHTEFLAALAGQNQSVMMLAADGLRVVPVTIHCALADVPRMLTQDLLKRTIDIVLKDFKTKLGIPTPRLAVAGLNPHAGENGAFGREEIEIITPVLDALRAQGVDILGPLSADTMFHEDMRQNYDCAICMYHDQALIPLKTLDFHGGVNVTLGLPFIRTSPDHGTAFDLAGTQKANPNSLINAIKMAHEMARHG